jgi:hypothetical protein
VKRLRRYHELKVLRSPLFRGFNFVLGVFIFLADAVSWQYLLFDPVAIVTPWRILGALIGLGAGIGYILYAIRPPPEEGEEDDPKGEDPKPDLRDS